jgi:hypothetical protein
MDPVTPLKYLIAGAVYLFDGKWEEAAEIISRSVVMDPGF